LPVPAPSVLALSDSERPDHASSIAYRRTPGKPPGIIFLGGFMSDMTGTKATRLERFARAQGHGFVRFDYTGHGASSGDSAAGTIGRWRDDALAVLDRLTEGPQILVGSSMGAWIALLLALARPDRVGGLATIAAAPDFTADLIEARLGPAQHAALARDGWFAAPSAYGPPYRIGRALLEDGRRHLLLRGPIAIAAPARLLHGMADPDVPWRTSLTLAERLAGRDVRLTLIKDGDHRLSRESDLVLIEQAVADLLHGSP
jgi:pimeloyl-ACP methyl ester carboxylesterase